MTMNDWLLAASVYWQQHSLQREGQAHFNSLYEHRPDIAQRIMHTAADPFHDDEKLPLFFQTVEALWG